MKLRKNEGVIREKLILEGWNIIKLHPGIADFLCLKEGFSFCDKCSNGMIFVEAKSKNRHLTKEQEKMIQQLKKFGINYNVQTYLKFDPKPK